MYRDNVFEVLIWDKEYVILRCFTHFVEHNQFPNLSIM